MAEKKAKKAAADTTKKKPATTKAAASARKPATKKVAAKKPAARKVVKKVAARKPAATKAKAPAKAKKAATTVKSRTPKTKAKGSTRAGKAPVTQSRPAARVRRAKSEVLEVSPAVIDTTSAAEVAARLVLDAHGPVTAAPSPLGGFTRGHFARGDFAPPPPPVAVKRGSSALRHVKESLNKPVALQLESVLGPVPVPAESMRRFLRNQKSAKQRVPGGTHAHFGQPTVPHRSVGNGGSRAGGHGGE